MKIAKIIAALIAFLLSLPAVATMYKYTDESGATGYADSLDFVPEQFRHTAVPIDESSLPGIKREKSVDLKTIESKTKELQKKARVEELKQSPYLVYGLGVFALIIAIFIWLIGRKMLRRTQR